MGWDGKVAWEKGKGKGRGREGGVLSERSLLIHLLTLSLSLFIIVGSLDTIHGIYTASRGSLEVSPDFVESMGYRVRAYYSMVHTCNKQA